MNETASRLLFDQDVGSLTERLLTSRNWKLYSKEFPVLDVGFRGKGRIELRLRFIANNWNDEPPSVELLDCHGNYLTGQQIPRSSGSNIFHLGPHNITKRPFVCMAGTREYHTHSSHTSDSWDNYKRNINYTIGGILHQIWNGWQKSNP